MSRLRSRTAVAIGLCVVIAGVFTASPTSSSAPIKTALAAPSVQAFPPTYGQASVFGLSRAGKVALSSVRVLGGTGSASKASSSLYALFRVPANQDRVFGISSAIPRTAMINPVSHPGAPVTISGTTATVDFTAPFFVGSSSSLKQRTAQVVYSLTAISGITKVAFKKNGVRVSRIGATGPYVGPGVSRAAFNSAAPAALVTSTRPGTHVTSPFTLSGTATSFEAVVHWKLLTLSGKVLQRGTAMATNSYRGTFHITVKTSYRGSVHFVVGSDSPAGTVDIVDPATTPLFIE